jgi:thiamine kinase-like enzyme
VDLARLTRSIRDRLAVEARPLALDARRLDVTPLLNRGGFVNRSFRVSDGRPRYHLKVSADPETRPGLERWRELHRRLERHYHAPRFLAWIDVPGTAFAGPLFEWIDGRIADPLHAPLLERIVRVVRALHADAALAERLASDEAAAATCADVYAEMYHARFTADLETIAPDRPPFVSTGDVDWMWHEAELLLALVQASASFAEPAAAPSHGDLWADNVLVSGLHDWHLLDWDGLALGDPALDWAMLFGPSRADVRPATAREATTALLRLDPATARRLTLYARASLLDWIIDPLSDWVGAAHEPEHGEAIRQANERTHREAMALYRSMMPWT